MANKVKGPTEREIYESIINGVADPDVLVEFAEKKLAQLDRRNATAKVRAEKKRAETDLLMQAVYECVGDEPLSREAITEMVVANGYEATVGKVTSRLSALVKEGRVSKAKTKVAGEDGKTKEQTVYALSFGE